MYVEVTFTVRVLRCFLLLNVLFLNKVINKYFLLHSVQNYKLHITYLLEVVIYIHIYIFDFLVRVVSGIIYVVLFILVFFFS